MEYATGPSGSDQSSFDGKALQGSPIADIVSLETVVNLLIEKGLFTPEELFEEERKRHVYRQSVKDLPVANTRRDRKKQTWLKRKMSKRRWTRRLGTSLFGWQWKKVKVNKDRSNIESHV